MDELEKIKIYAQMLLEVVNQAEIKRYQEKKDAANAKEQQMLIDLSGISVSSKQRRDGRYQGYYTLDGTKHFIYGKSVNEVKTKIEFFLKHGAPKKKPAKKKADMKKAAPTVSEWLTQWIEFYKAPNLKPSTMKSLQGSLKIVFQRLGDKDLTQITTEDLQVLLLGIQGGRARDMCKGYLEQAFRKAFLRGIISKDPCQALEIKKHRQEHRNALTRQQQAQFLAALDGITTKPLLVFLLATGLRVGEALALTFADIDFHDKTVSVNK
ncbi:MAG: tyrosine-type recombinase/integrase, partial [Candidatus Borkfalkia sp.]